MRNEMIATQIVMLASRSGPGELRQRYIETELKVRYS